jgi:hypothetical protein
MSIENPKHQKLFDEALAGLARRQCAKQDIKATILHLLRKDRIGTFHNLYPALRVLT